jgi:tRNA(Leu) C34 or U34 (ribose-2'-O)-methylase TrmL
MDLGSALMACTAFGVDAILYTGNDHGFHKLKHTYLSPGIETIHFETAERLIEHAEKISTPVMIESGGDLDLTHYRHPENVTYLFTHGQYRIEEIETVRIPTMSALNLATLVPIVLYDRKVKKFTGAVKYE